jgi:hypothetical protein
LPGNRDFEQRPGLPRDVLPRQRDPLENSDGDGSTAIGAIVDHAVGTTTVTVKLGSKTLGTTDVIIRPGVLTTVTVPPN